MCCHGEAACHQLPVAVVFWITSTVSLEGCSRVKPNLMQIRCSTLLVILNVMATQYTCSLNGVYHPHWLVQWSHLCSRMCIPVHFPWLPGYIHVSQTIPVILTMAGLLLDRPSIFLLLQLCDIIGNQKVWGLQLCYSCSKLAIQSLLFFHIIYRTCFNFCKTRYWDFDEDCIKSIDCFGKYEHFNDSESSHPQTLDISLFICVCFNFFQQCFTI